MHHAFPNECPYPHVSGSTAPKRPDEWMAERQEDPVISAEARSQHTERHSGLVRPADKDGELLLRWDAEEELIASPVSGREGGDVSWCKKLASAAQAFRTAMSSAGSLKATLSSGPPLGPEKFS